MKGIQKSLAIFCIATYGEGDPTDNAMDFYEWLQNGDADLEGLNYAVCISTYIIENVTNTFFFSFFAFTEFL